MSVTLWTEILTEISMSRSGGTEGVLTEARHEDPGFTTDLYAVLRDLRCRHSDQCPKTEGPLLRPANDEAPRCLLIQLVLASANHW